MGELIVCGAVSFETALGLSIAQIEFLFECRQRAQAAERAALTDDTAAAVVGCLSEDGHKSLRKHLKALQAIAEGAPDEVAVAYTDKDLIRL